MPDILSDIEKEAIAIFLENKTMHEAVRKVLLAGIYYNGTLKPGEDAHPLQNFALSLANDVENQGLGSAISNEALGADLRASTKAVRLIELAYKQLKNYVPTPPVSAKKEKPNKGQ